MSAKIWLRAETKEKERRTSLTPENAHKLVQQGAHIVVENDPHRIFPINDYEEAGCEIALAHSWQQAPLDYYILGLKEIVDDTVKFKHNHIYFAHVFKGQSGSQEILKRYKEDGGTLFDLEYLTDQNQRRIAAFGHWAGFAGAAFALDRFYHRQYEDLQNYPELRSYPTIEELLKTIAQKKEKAPINNPKVMIIGALGRCGRGAAELLNHFDIQATSWDYQETKIGGPFEKILEHDIMINAALILNKIPPFIDDQLLRQSESILKIIADVSCDPNSDLNPIPIYNESTTWEKPFLPLNYPHPVEVLSVDNLPSTLPLESSIDFSDQLYPWLEELVQKKGSLPLPFENAKKVFADFTK